jgi:putative ABC transport system substrate-binding protein
MFGRMIHTWSVLRAGRANASWGGIWVVVLSLVAFGSPAMAVHAQGAPATPIGTPTVPIAYDGRTLYYESFATQATFKTVWGDRAEARWVDEHNAELAQGQPLSGPHIVFVSSGSASTTAIRDAVVVGLREQGYIPGHTIAVQWRYTEGNTNVLDALAAEVIGLRPDLIVTSSTPESVAFKKATSTIPIVFAGLGDPVGAGVVPSLERPGGNVTGMTNSPPQFQARRLTLLKEALPGATHVGVLRNSSNPTSAGVMQQVQSAAASVGVQVEDLPVARVPDDLAAAFDTATQGRVDAVIEISDASFGIPANRARIVDLATQARLPLMGSTTTLVNGQLGGGSLMGSSVNGDELDHMAAAYVAKILRGTKPGDLPVGSTQSVDFVINLRAAQAIGFTFPASIVAKATNVIR